MKPPSGLARRKGGCRLGLGWRSDSVRAFLNSGTGRMAGGFARNGDFGSVANMAFSANVDTVDEGYPSCADV